MAEKLLEWHFSFFAMGSPCQLRIYLEEKEEAEEVSYRIQSEVARLEQLYSRYRDDSVVTKINRSAGKAALTVDPETAGLLDYAQTVYEQSDGLFDITSGILRSAWDFKSGIFPEPVQIEKILPLVDWSMVEWNSPNIRLPEIGMELDFGGYVKEYAVDAAARLCGELGVSHGMIDLGGDIHIIGPHPDGSAWHVGIRNPRSPEDAIVSVDLQSGAIASSGDYERFMEVDGKRYCHILNPKTGWPCEGLAAVAVAAPICLLAGTASTIAMLKGREAGPEWLKELGLPYFWVATDGESGGDLV